MQLNSADAFDDFPQGPDKKPEAMKPKKEKYSEALKRMKAAPAGDRDSAPSVCDDAAATTSLAMLPEDKGCYWKTARGARCIKTRTGPRFCTMHERIAHSDV